MTSRVSDEPFGEICASTYVRDFRVIIESNKFKRRATFYNKNRFHVGQLVKAGLLLSLGGLPSLLC